VEGRYRLDRLIGKGGMGAVYEARDLRLERTVAVKILPGRAFGEPSALRRFRREARAAAQLSHPHIVSVYDYGALEAEGAYIVMERVEGATLRATLERVRRLSPAEAAEWFDTMLEGAAAAHAQGIVHRDLKPDNVIGQRDAAGQLNVKILDFGIAKVSDRERGTDSMTADGIVVGTVGYMSPEQILGQAVDARTDVFAIGVMLAEALGGARLFPGRPFPEFSRQVLAGDYSLPEA
jgi:serine/threonine-protein kinase